MTALLFSDTPLTDLSYDSMASNQEVFSPRVIMPPRPTKSEVRGKTLSGYQYAHTLHRHLIFEMTISSTEISTVQELTNDKLTHLLNFWNAPYRYVSYPDGADYIEVLTDGEEFPIAYIEGIIYLPEVTLRLTTVNPVSDELIAAIALLPVSMFPI